VDVLWRDVHRGHNRFVSWLHIIGQELADLVVQAHEFIATDDTVVVLGHESARVTATGRTYHSDFAFVFRVRNGKLTAFRAYHDTDAMTRATAAR
jgi:ketosteroid isomerase-like protein